MSGVPVTIVQLPAITPEGADSVPAWDSSTGLTGRVTLSGLGAIFALLTGASFTGLVETTGTVRANDTDTGAAEKISFSVGRNSNVTTPAPGNIVVNKVVGSAARLFPDDTGIWRTQTTAMTNANYASAAVVGAQTSALDQKDVLGEAAPISEVLGYIAEGAAAVRRFQYKATEITDEEGNVIAEGPRPYNGEEFSGVIVDYCGRYGTDSDETHPNGKSLNTINVAGDLLLAVNWLMEQNVILAARLAALEGQ